MALDSATASCLAYKYVGKESEQDATNYFALPPASREYDST